MVNGGTLLNLFLTRVMITSEEEHAGLQKGHCSYIADLRGWLWLYWFAQSTGIDLIYTNFRGEAMAKTTTQLRLRPTPLNTSLTQRNVTTLLGFILSSLNSYVLRNPMKLKFKKHSSVDPEFFEVLCPQKVEVEVEVLRKKTQNLFHLTCVNG